PTDDPHLGYWGRSLWQHAVECGLASRRIAEASGQADPEEAFVGGMLHDIGKLVMLLNLPDEHRHLRQRQLGGGGANLAAERQGLGFDHTEVGRLLLERWNMPAALVACASHHHAPAAADDHTLLVRVVEAGNLLSHVCGTLPDANGGDGQLNELLASLAVPADALDRLTERFARDLEECVILS
ncbi:MAG: HDOD domain-containing protein, partial [Candidatus Krumholzibacteriia bacterium]